MTVKIGTYILASSN